MGDSTHHSDDHLHRRGLMFILSSPSGAGKTTLSRKLLEADHEIKLSVSVTTRPPRPGEIDGVHYTFVSNEQFDAMVAEDDFYEWAEVFGNRYGSGTVEVAASGRSAVDRALVSEARGRGFEPRLGQSIFTCARAKSYF